MRTIRFVSSVSWSVSLSVSLSCSLLAACGSGSSSLPQISYTPMTLSADKKGCVDQVLGKPADAALPVHEEGSRDNIGGHDDHGDDHQLQTPIEQQNARQHRFEQVAARCGLSQQEGELYLQYSNVVLGLPSDSLENTQVVSGARVLLAGSASRGSAMDVFADGHALVSWDGAGGPVAEPIGLLAVAVRSRGGIAAEAKVIARGGAPHGSVKEVFANGVAVVKWSNVLQLSFQNVSALASAVSCNGLFCENDRVGGLAARAQMRGTIRGVYSDGRALVKWDNVLGETLEPLMGLTPEK